MTLRELREVRLVRCLGGHDRSTGVHDVGESRRVFVDRGSGGCGQAGCEAGSEAGGVPGAAYRRERVERDRRLERLAVEVLTALGERDAMIAATEQRAGAALQAMIIDEHLTVSEAAQWCAGAISHREAARLRQLAGPAENRPVNHSTLTADARRHDREGEFH